MFAKRRVSAGQGHRFSGPLSLPSVAAPLRRAAPRAVREHGLGPLHALSGRAPLRCCWT